MDDSSIKGKFTIQVYLTDSPDGAIDLTDTKLGWLVDKYGDKVEGLFHNPVIIFLKHIEFTK